MSILRQFSVHGIVRSDFMLPQNRIHKFTATHPIHARRHFIGLYMHSGWNVQKIVSVTEVFQEEKK